MYKSRGDYHRDCWTLLEITVEITKGYWRLPYRLLKITGDYRRDYWRLLEITREDYCLPFAISSSMPLQYAHLWSEDKRTEMVQPGADNEKQMPSFFAVSCTYHTIVNIRDFHWDKQLQILLCLASTHTVIQFLCAIVSKLDLNACDYLYSLLIITDDSSPCPACISVCASSGWLALSP